jgi:hypothetical protein
MPRRIGAWIECVFDHPREGMQAFEAVHTFGIAEFGCAERCAKHRNGPIVNSCRHREGPAILAAMRERKPRGIAETAGGAVDDLTDKRQLSVPLFNATLQSIVRLIQGLMQLILRNTRSFKDCELGFDPTLSH